MAIAGKLTIRRATEEDARGVLDCLAAAFEPFRAQYTTAGFEDTILTPALIRQRLASMAIFVALDEASRVVGTIACGAVSADEGHLRGMAVLPESQGGGLAARLLAAAEDELRHQYCSHVTLDTTAPLKRAIKFYEKHGYKASGKVSDFYGMALYEYVKELPAG